ncbi:MAG TPA: PfkB family carbohydrate kinase [Phototrophicaceae bacterium]|nr:PfkB family carbohydrate kinase [Phototrophicaceae bacterium]
MTTADVIVSGHLCLDLIPRMERVALNMLTAPGQLWEVGPLDFATGGAVSNTGVALHRVGVNVRLLATVGDDLIGQMIIRILADRDPALTRLISVQSGQPGSYTIILEPERVDRIFLHCTGTNQLFGLNNIDFALLPGAKIFHFGYPPLLPQFMVNDGEQLQALYQRVQSMGIATSLDMTTPDRSGPAGQVNWVKILQQTLAYVDIFIPSIEEITFMLRRADFENWYGSEFYDHLTAAYLRDLADELLSLGVAIAGFKLGRLGIYLKTAGAERLQRLTTLNLNADIWANQEVYSPAFAVNVVGTTGAGDSAYAGFLAALLRGLSPNEAVRWACAVGACNVEAADATSGIRTWEQTQARLVDHWPLRPERLKGWA